MNFIVRFFRFIFGLLGWPVATALVLTAASPVIPNMPLPDIGQPTVKVRRPRRHRGDASRRHLRRRVREMRRTRLARGQNFRTGAYA